MTTGQADLLTSILQRVVTGHREACRAGRSPRRRQDRDDRQLRGRLVRRVHAAARGSGLGRLSRRAEADADRVRRRACRRRYPARQIWKSFMTPPQATQAEPERSPATPVHPGSGEAHRLARGLVQARQRLLPGHPCRRLLPGPRAYGRGGVLRERGRGSARRRKDDRIGERGSRGAAARQRADRCPGQARQAPRLRHQAGATEGFSLRERHGAPLRDAARPTLRTAAEPRRHKRPNREIPSPQARGTTRIIYEKGPEGSVLEQTPEPGSPPAVASRWRWSWAVGSDRRDGPRGPARSPDHVAPRETGRLRDPDPRRRIDLHRAGRWLEDERRLEDRRAVVEPAQTERLRQLPRARAQTRSP